jgi:hypothetical protein
MTTEMKVALLASPNFVVVFTLAAVRLPPGADVVSMMAYVSLSASVSGDDDCDGVCDGVAVVDFVPDRDGVFVAVGEKVEERDFDNEAPIDGVFEGDGVGLDESMGTPVTKTPRPYATPAGAVAAQAPPLFVDV